MGKYVLKRVLMLIPTFFLIITLVFVLMRFIPGSPIRSMYSGEDLTPQEVEALEEEYGFNDPIYVQYGRYIAGIIKGDWGDSYFTHKPVFQSILDVWEPTVLITVFATLITVSIAIPIGVLSATHRNSLLDYTTTSLSMVSMTIPSVCWGLLLLYFFAYKLDWFPIFGYKQIAKDGFGAALICIALPSISLGTRHIASLVRYTRSTMLDVLNQDYIRTAKAKGLSRGKIYYKHALKNTLSVVATLVAGSIATMLGGSAVTERVFSIRGVGALAVDSLTRRDYSQEQAIVLFCAMICLGVNLLMDIFYKALDPRIEYE